MLSHVENKGVGEEVVYIHSRNDSQNTKGYINFPRYITLNVMQLLTNTAGNNSCLTTLLVNITPTNK